MLAHVGFFCVFGRLFAVIYPLGPECNLSSPMVGDILEGFPGVAAVGRPDRLQADQGQQIGKLRAAGDSEGLTADGDGLDGFHGAVLTF